jgi:tetratricopeptide (TPR) repeat protein
MTMKKRLIFALMLVLPAVFLMSGCSGGVNGEGGNTYSQTSGTPVVRSANFNDSAWDLMERGSYESAIVKFNQVLADSPTVQEAAEANNGIGWSRAFIGSLKDGMPWFEKAMGLSDDAKVGMAAGYVQLASKADLEKAAAILFNDLGKGNPHFRYTPRRKNGVNDAECHALLAYAFVALGKTDEALTQLEWAKTLNPNWANTTIDQIGKMVDFLGR